MKIRIENEYTYEAEFDFDLLVSEFESEWEDFMGDGMASADEEDKADFVKEMVSEMGARYFISEVVDLGGSTKDDHSIQTTVLK